MRKVRSSCDEITIIDQVVFAVVLLKYVGKRVRQMSANIE